MVGDLFSNLIACESCGHGIGVHDGGGCHARLCDCGHTMQTILEETIAISTREFQQQFRVAD